MILRLVLKTAPRRVICLLWLVAGLRLLLPFQIESGLSLQPDSRDLFQPQTQSDFFQSQPAPAVPDDAVLPDDVEIVTGDAFADPGPYFEYPVQQPTFRDWRAITARVWLVGVCAMAIYSGAAYLALRRRVRMAVKVSDNVYQCAGLDTAFVLGFFRPRIYVPAENSYVLAHERAHIRRGDHWFKLLGFAALALHWFNPLVWAAYLLLCRDLEMACDEAVVRDMDLAERKAYSAALLACAARRSAIAACPVAFGEVSVKQRIVSVLNYRKPRFWICVTAAAAVLIVTVCFLTSPGGMTKDEALEAFYDEMDAIQSSPKLHLSHTEERECEIDTVVELVHSDCWVDGDLNLQTFYYATDGGHYTTCFVKVDGVPYTRQYSNDMEGFIDSEWQEVPDTYDPGVPLMFDFRSMEVMEVKKDRTHDGAYAIKLAGNLSSVSAPSTLFEKYYDIHLDSDGHLLCIHQFTHGEFYMSEHVSPGIYESKIYTTITVEPWDDAWKNELADLDAYKERLFQELTLKKCQLALLDMRSRDSFYVTEDVLVENNLSGTETAHIDIWKHGNDWLYSRESSNLDGTSWLHYMEADSVRYERSASDHPENGGFHDSGWQIDEVNTQRPWLLDFDPETAEMVFVEHEAALGGQQMVVFNIITGEEDGFTNGYTLKLYLDDGVLESAERTFLHNYSDLETERITVTMAVVSTDTAEAAAAINEQIQIIHEQMDG